jgi:hypothetical protein
MLRIRDILVLILIRGSASLSNGSGSCYCTVLFSLLTFKSPTKNFFVLSVSPYYFLNVNLLTSVLKIKRHKEVTKQKESRFFFLFLIDDRRIQICTSDQWIRIQKTRKTYGSGSATLLIITRARSAIIFLSDADPAIQIRNLGSDSDPDSSF